MEATAQTARALRRGQYERLYLIAIVTLMPGIAGAREDRLFLGGAELSSGNSYAYVGLVAPLTKKDDSGSGFVQRYWADWLTYTYNKNAEEIQAQAWGAEAAIGYILAGRAGWSGFYVGGVLRDTTTSPEDPENVADGTHLRLKFQLEGELTPANWRIAGIAAYITGQQQYWMRARVLHSVGEHLWTGPELIYQGDPTYKRAQIGWALDGVKIGKGFLLGVKGGVSRNEGQSTHPYAGIEIARWF
jgi:hypothetical protein